MGLSPIDCPWPRAMNARDVHIALSPTTGFLVGPFVSFRSWLVLVRWTWC